MGKQEFRIWCFFRAFWLAVAIAFVIAGCAAGPLTTREKGAGIGALGGAAVGGIIGAAVNHPGAGAAIGGAIGLGAGALIGDQLQGQENQNEKAIKEFERCVEEAKRDYERTGKKGPYSCAITVK